MDFLKVGHFTNLSHRTGVSVFLFDRPVIGSYLIPGSSPASRELHTLDLASNVNEIHGLAFMGGSAFGLGAIDGVMQYLQEQGKGRIMPHGGLVPIVPGAAIYDLANVTAAIPTAENAYQACLDAKLNNETCGSIGAGTGATVGKLVPDSQRMSGGFGCASLEIDKIKVSAYAVVNAVGDVRDYEGRIIAGARNHKGEFSDCEKYLLSGHAEAYYAYANTTLVSVFTNVKFSKIELHRIAKMAIAGMARAITPIFTRYDGDIMFCFSLGEEKASEVMIGTIASELVRRAIVNAVSESVVVGI